MGPMMAGMMVSVVVMDGETHNLLGLVPLIRLSSLSVNRFGGTDLEAFHPARGEMFIATDMP
jgi:hypothetical protein